MRIHADFSLPVLIDGDDLDWVASPAGGVERAMLDRIGDEVARATSFVRFAPGSSFPPHDHGGGEEFLVLEGTFCDEDGCHPAGSYVRNPPGTRHSPSAPDGCMIFVKLWQFDPNDLSPVALDTGKAAWPEEAQDGARWLVLHRHKDEHVRMCRLDAGARLSLDTAPHGLEVLVVKGNIRIGNRQFGRLSWLRQPPGEPLDLTAASPAEIYIKQGHLPPA